MVYQSGKKAYVKSMATKAFNRERLACAYFFGCMGIAYGIFTSRMPALKDLIRANDADIGFLLLAFGGASVCGLLSCAKIMERFSAKQIGGMATLGCMAALCIVGLAFSFWQIFIFCLLAGFAGGLCEVAMNSQGIILEKRHKRLCMSFLHAFFSLGGVAGALSGSLFAALHLAPFYNFTIICGLYALLWLWAYRNTEGEPPNPAPNMEKRIRPPLLVICFGLMSMCCFVTEGSVGEWGSILLHSVKGAPERQAALVFACFSACMVICRMTGDRLRDLFGDFLIVFCGSSLACASMIVVLLADSPVICLAAYGCMGIGMATIVPILYSRAGKIPGITPGQASSAMSIMSYTGLLFFPPLLGLLAQSTGLDRALWVIVAVSFLIAASSFILRAKQS